MADIEIDYEIIERLKKNIIKKENENLRTREKSDSKMVDWIKDQIEEEVNAFKIN